MKKGNGKIFICLQNNGNVSELEQGCHASQKSGLFGQQFVG